MSKINYEYFGNKEDDISISRLLHDNEKVLWSAIPKPKAYVAEQILSILPFILTWLLFDIIFLVIGIVSGDVLYTLPFVIVFIMPVIIWIISIIRSKKTIINDKYYITSERAIIISGVTPFVKNDIALNKITRTELNQSKTDALFKVADLYITSSSGSIVFNDILDSQTIKQKLDALVSNASEKEKFYQFSRECDYCGSTVDKTTKKCPYCGATIDLKY